MVIHGSKKRQSIYSIVALGAITGLVLIVFSMVSYYLLVDNVQKSKSLAATINVSGRQRMLTERIALLSLSVAVGRDSPSRESTIAAEKAAINHIKTANQALFDYAKKSSIQEMFTSPPYDINKKIARYTENALAFLNGPAQAQTTQNTHLTDVLASSQDVIAAYNSLTQAFQDEAEVNTTAIIHKGIAVMLLEILTIILLGLFVFNPLVRRMGESLKRLMEAESFANAIMHFTASGLVSTDDKGVIATFNPAAERLFGYRADEVVGKNVKVLVPESYRGEHDTFIARYVESNAPHIIGLRRAAFGQTKNGHIFPIHLSVDEMAIGNQRYFIADIRDITKDKAIERNLQIAKEKAELANRAKDSFLTTMSHEVRTPLSGMLGMLEVLSLTKLDTEQKQTLQAAWDSAHSLLRIVSDILDWSKIDEGKLSIVPRSTSIPQLLQDVVNTYSRVASSKNLNLRQYADPNIGPAHLVDALRLSQILNNFVSNAIKFTSRGEVEVRAELLRHFESGEQIRFSVRDTGAGISKKAQQHLFQRYVQESEDTARLYGGTGLGLAICRRLADLMDGVIELESEVGHGSTFSVTMVLPISGAPGEAPVTLQPEMVLEQPRPLFADSAAAPLILVVDDHPINRELLSRQISLLGLRAVTAANGQEGFSEWQKGQFAMVITDCHMPELDGYGLSRAIRDAELMGNHGSSIPIIGWTANAVGDEASLCSAAGMDDLLIKPTNMAKLRETLVKWLELLDQQTPDDTPAADSKPEFDDDEPIDIDSLKQVVPDPSIHAQILRDFLAHIKTDTASLRDSLNKNDAIEVERTAHRMKGSCRMVGAKRLAAECASIEAAAQAGLLDKARASDSGLDALISQVEAYITRVYQDD